MIKGIDISSWQGTPNFTKVKNGFDFVFVKAVEGFGFRDPQLTRNQKELRALRIPRGYYAFVRPDLGNSASKEAQYLLDQIGTLEEGEILLLDYEVDYKDTVNWCKAWLDYVYKETGVKALIYLNKSLQSNNNWLPVINEGYGLWLADYTHNADSTPPKTQWPFIAIRQYTNREVVDGISENVDGNVFYGDVKALLDYGFNGSVADPGLPGDYLTGYFKLTNDIPTEIEDLFSLKEKSWYDKHWTFEDFIRYCISINKDEVAYRAFLQYINAKLLGVEAVAPKSLKDEEADLQFNIETALQIIKDGITKDIAVFSDTEIRNEFVERLFNSILGKFGIKK